MFRDAHCNIFPRFMLKFYMRTSYWHSVTTTHTGTCIYLWGKTTSNVLYILKRKSNRWHTLMYKLLLLYRKRYHSSRVHCYTIDLCGHGFVVRYWYESVMDINMRTQSLCQDICVYWWKKIFMLDGFGCTTYCFFGCFIDKNVLLLQLKNRTYYKLNHCLH